VAKRKTSGQTFEGVIESLFTSNGIRVARQVQLSETSIYGKRIRVDFLTEPDSRVPKGLIVEAKWQDVTGTAEEKLPYLVINIKRFYPYPTIVVIDGHGFTAGAIRWIKRQVDNEKLIGVFSIKEFISWCNREL